jgi:hypothetical protein
VSRRAAEQLRRSGGKGARKPHRDSGPSQDLLAAGHAAVAAVVAADTALYSRMAVLLDVAVSALERAVGDRKASVLTSAAAGDSSVAAADERLQIAASAVLTALHAWAIHFRDDALVTVASAGVLSKIQVGLLPRVAAHNAPCAAWCCMIVCGL